MPTPANNNIGSSILDLSGMLSRTYSKSPSGKQVKYVKEPSKKVGVISEVKDNLMPSNLLSAGVFKFFIQFVKREGKEAERCKK
jgi:hypothetical protein